VTGGRNRELQLLIDVLRAAGVTFSVVGSMARDAPLATDLDITVAPTEANVRGIERVVGQPVPSRERSPQQFVTSYGPLDVFWVPT